MGKYNIQRDRYSKAVDRTRKFPTGVMFESNTPPANALDIGATVANSAATGASIGGAIGGPVGAAVGGAAMGVYSLGSELVKRQKTISSNRTLDQQRKAYEMYGDKALDDKDQPLQARKGLKSNRYETVEMEKGEVHVDGDNFDVEIGTRPHEEGGDDIDVKPGDFIVNSQNDPQKRHKIIALASAAKSGSLAAKAMLQEEAKKLPQGEVKPNGKYTDGAWFNVIDAEAKRLNVDANTYLDELGKNDEYKKAFRQEAINQGQNYDDWVAQGGIIGGVPVKRDLRYKAVGPQTAAKWKEHYVNKSETTPSTIGNAPTEAPVIDNTPFAKPMSRENVAASFQDKGLNPDLTEIVPQEPEDPKRSLKDRLNTFASKFKKEDKEEENKKEDKGLFSSSDSPYRYTNALYNTLRGLSGPDKTAAVPLRLDRYKDKTDVEQQRQDILMQQKIMNRNADTAYTSKGESGSSKAMVSAQTTRSLAELNRSKYERSAAIQKANTDLANTEAQYNVQDTVRVNEGNQMAQKAQREFTGAASQELTQQKQQAIVDYKKDANDRLGMGLMNDIFDFKVNEKTGKVEYDGKTVDPNVAIRVKNMTKEAGDLKFNLKEVNGRQAFAEYLKEKGRTEDYEALQLFIH
jgi:hypothetical protein